MPSSKWCPRCDRELPLSRYNYRDKAQTRIQSYCRECSSSAWREWYAVPSNKAHHLQILSARRKRRIARNKALVLDRKNVPCADCGRRLPPEAMDFDHLGDKEALISKLVYSSGTERLLAEIAKCEVVCSNCHRVRTTARLKDQMQ